MSLITRTTLTHSFLALCVIAVFSGKSFAKDAPLHWYSIGTDFVKNNWYTGSSTLDDKQMFKALQSSTAIRLDNLRGKKNDKSPWEKSSNDLRQGVMLLSTKHIVAISVLTGDPLIVAPATVASEGSEPKNNENPFEPPAEEPIKANK